ADNCWRIYKPEEHVETHYGNVHCIMTGTPKANLPVVLTFHDVGLNHKSCFDTLFNHEDMREIIRHLPVCHVEAPGQHEGAKTLHAEYSYPSMDQLSEALPAVLKHFGVIGLGVGAGAYILAKFALNHPDLVDGLVLININPSAEGLMDSVASKVSSIRGVITHNACRIRYLPSINTTCCIDNKAKLQWRCFLRSYNNRTALEVERPVAGGNINARTLKCSTLLVVGDNSPAVEAVVDCNSKLDPTKTTLLKMADCGGLPQVDQPAKVIEALKYFIQGMGYSDAEYKKHLSSLSPVSSASMTRLRSRTASGSSVSSMDGSRSRAHTNELQRARTHSRGTEEKRGRSHTDVSMECISNSSQITSKSTQVS
uniref:Protein NDRG2 n=1 Tax=Cyclopterus lumpus TaxID=8103 RepID=A0A8C2X3K9_CYCLU